MLMEETKIKCQPLTEQETAVVLSVPALIGSMIEIQNMSDNCHKFVIETLNKFEDLDCITANRDEKGKLLGIRLLLHNIINQVDVIKPIVEESKLTIKSYAEDYVKKSLVNYDKEDKNV